ncbi:variable large family protein (plasmid) [Borrelia coriaceae]|uniref:variable large family protein n=1 Tax=Borrelia coriaceae TaxID=144 RepID=UPI0004AFA3A4|nr:variable large family protein [Borrelia coriaceae]UPA17532.1 variable large family protein [Borrelia coriaceae]
MKINIKNIKIKSICATLFISLFLSCNSGVIEELEKKNTFFDSLIKIGHGFQEIFGSFGDALGFNAVKSDDPKNKVGEHFNKVKKGLEDTKEKLDGLAKEISSTPHADTKGVAAVKEAVKKAIDEVISKLIDSITKLAGAVDSTDIGHNSTGAAVAANPGDVKTVIESVKMIIDLAENSGIKIKPGDDGGAGASAADNTATDILGGTVTAAGGGSKLADEVSKADSWAMIDKIRNATTKEGALDAAASNNAGELATGSNAAGNNGAKAATNADLVAAVALKAMTKKGKFSAHNDDAGAVKAAAASAVNKVLGILDLIISKIVNKHLEKVREAVKEIKYSESTGEATESGTVTK